MIRPVWGATRRTLRWVRRLLLAVLLPLLLLAALGQWWLLPRLNDYRDDLAAVLQDYLRAPVRIEAVTGVRDGWRLGLRLRGVKLSDPSSGVQLASFSQAAVTLNLWRSLRTWRPVFTRIRLEGVRLTLEQGADGIPRLRADNEPAEPAPALTEVARKLFEIRYLDIVGDRLTVRLADGNTVQILHPYFQVRDTDAGQRLIFTAELPAELGDRLQLSLERTAIATGSWGGHFEFTAERLNLAGWPLPVAFAAGRVGVKLQGEWRDWQAQRLKGELRWQRVAVRRDARAVLLEPWLAQAPDGGLRFDGRPGESGWQWQGQAWFGDGKGQAVAQPNFTLNRAGERWQGDIRDLQVQDLIAWVSPWLDEPARQWLAALDLRGALPTLAVGVEFATGAYSVSAQLRDGACQSAHGLPGMNHIDGAVEIAPDRGRIELDSRAVRVDTHGLLRAPITLDTLAGVVNWQRAADALQLESAGLDLHNPDFTARFQGQVTIPDQGGPVLDLRGEYHGVRGDQARRYLPVAVIPPAGVAWLDQALVGGRVVSGEMVLRGPPAAFPFDRDEGLFETHFQIENGVLDYAPGWPRLQQIQAKVIFRNRGLRIEGESGRLEDANVQSAVVWIDDLAHPLVRVKGGIKGPSASMWQVLQDSPVGHQLGKLPDLRFTGANVLDLELDIPTDGRPNRIHGRVGLLEGGLSMAGWNIELKRLRGEVRFSEAGLESRDVQASLRGEPVRLNLELGGAEDRRELQARLRGRVSLRALIGEPAAMLGPYLSGKSVWDMVLAIPTGHREPQSKPLLPELQLSSDLRGLAILLPEPLGKTADAARPLKITLHPNQDLLDLDLEYGADTRAALALSGFPEHIRFERGEVRIGAGAAQLPDTAGLAIIAELPRWQPSLLPAAAPDTPGATTAGASPSTAAFWAALHHVEARIGELVLAGQSFPNVTLQATYQDNNLLIELAGETLQGRVTVPDRPVPDRPVNAALQRLALRHEMASDLGEKEHDASLSVAKLQRLPPLVLTVAELRLNDQALGRLRLITEPRPGGQRLQDFELKAEQQRVDASGEWLQTIDGPVTRLQATGQSQALGDTLAAFGFAGSGIARGQTEAELTVEWAGTPADFALEQLEGRLKFHVGSGQLLDVDPGMGRVVGLFNVQNLLRRLTLDFSDLFQPGMGFDRISGVFDFRHGQAYTDDLAIDAPAAQILIQGRVGLKARDYDQQVTVTPHFGGALPVAGALAGGPAVGAAVFVAERILQKGIEHVTRYRYRLTGSWDAPVLTAQHESPPANPTPAFVGDH